MSHYSRKTFYFGQPNSMCVSLGSQASQLPGCVYRRNQPAMTLSNA
jgi:hypothetical protein